MSEQRQRANSYKKLHAKDAKKGRTCPRCEGAGTVRGQFRPVVSCPQCHGSGRV